MSISMERLSDLERRMKASLKPEEIDPEVEKRIQKLATTMRVDGFRVGKVPRKLISQKYGASVRSEVVGEKIEKNLGEVFRDEKLRPVNAPEIEILMNVSGAPVEYVATFEIYPEIKFDTLSSFNLKEKTADITDADIDRVIHRWQKMAVKWAKVDRASKKDDRVSIDYETHVNGEHVKDGNAESVPVILGSGTMLPAIEDGLVAVVENQELELTVNIPAGHQDKQLAGKPAQLKIKVRSVEEPVLPEIDDEFIARHGVAEGGIEKLREEIKNSLGTQLHKAVLNEMKSELFEILADKYDFALPQSLVRQEEVAIAERAEQLKQKPADDQELTKQAEKAVRLGLILGQFIADNSLQADEQKVNESLVELTYQYGGSEEIYKILRSNKELMGRITSSVLEDQAVEKMLESVQKTPVVCTFAEVLKLDEHEHEHGHDHGHVHGPDCDHDHDHSH